jgi:hypothetical protein
MFEQDCGEMISAHLTAGDEAELDSQASRHSDGDEYDEVEATDNEGEWPGEGEPNERNAQLPTPLTASPNITRTSMSEAHSVGIGEVPTPSAPASVQSPQKRSPHTYRYAVSVEVGLEGAVGFACSQ